MELSDTNELLEILESVDHQETDVQTQLRHQASDLITTSTKSSTDDPILSSTLHTLLTTVIKPLFSKTQHPSLTSTGRKVLVPAPPIPTRFNDDDNSIFSPPPPWKTQWTSTLLCWILRQYPLLFTTKNSNNKDPTPQQRKVLEDHFHLLIPPTLNHLDDHEIPFKIQGCTLLTQLCNTLITLRSDTLNRTGLAEVFFETLRGSFHYIPSLTPEDESLALLQALYPAYLCVVKARFTSIEEFRTVSKTHNPNDDEVVTITLPKTPPHSSQQLTHPQISTEITLRVKHLTTLLRHSLLYTLHHLQTSASSGTTTSIPITTFLLTQIPIVLGQMDIYASSHLHSLVPVLVNILRDPFVGLTTAPGMLGAAIDALEGVVCCCWVRVGEKWWVDVLRGVVAAWLNLVGDLDGGSGGRLEEGRGLMEQMRRLVGLLEDVVGKNVFGDVKRKLVSEDDVLRGLFERTEEDDVVGSNES